MSASNPSLLRVEDDRPMRPCSSLTRIRTSTVLRTLASFSEATHAIASIAQTPTNCLSDAIVKLSRYDEASERLRAVPVDGW